MNYWMEVNTEEVFCLWALSCLEKHPTHKKENFSGNSSRKPLQTLPKSSPQPRFKPNSASACEHGNYLLLSIIILKYFTLLSCYDWQKFSKTAFLNRILAHSFHIQHPKRDREASCLGMFFLWDVGSNLVMQSSILQKAFSIKEVWLVCRKDI